MKLQTILTVLQIVSIVVSLGVTTFGFFVKREVKRLDESDKENKLKHKELEDKITSLSEERQKCNKDCIQSLSEFKEEAYTTFVRNADFIRINAEIMKKLDKIFDILFEMKGK